MKNYSDNINSLKNLKQQHISIVGLSGVGKTTLANQLKSHFTNYNHVDIDSLVEDFVGCSIKEYIENNGVEKFRVLEKSFLYITLLSKTPTIISTGGGVVLDSQSRQQLRNLSKVIWLDYPLEEVVNNCILDGIEKRPLLTGCDSKEELFKKIAETYSIRKPFYEEIAHYRIENSTNTNSNLANVIKQFQLPVGVVVGENLFSDVCENLNKYEKVSIICSKAVKDYAIKISNELIVDNFIIELENGEEIKSVSELEKLCNELSNKGIKRNHALLAVGGGTITDLVGLLGAVYMRGVDTYYYPTTLLAQVDAAIGGKTGVDLECGKNMLGTFTQPMGVFCDINVLGTLPKKEFQSSLGEIIKYGLIGNQKIIQEIKTAKTLDDLDFELLVKESVKHKLEVVSSDEFEQIGVRASLNFGHTLAHAIEKLSDFSIPHGMAVSIGSYFILKLQEKLSIKSVISVNEYIDLCNKFELVYQIPKNIEVKNIIECMQKDKKSEGKITFVFYDDQKEWLIESFENDDQTVISTLEECYES